MAKTLELWDGYEVTVNEQLIDDFDFIADLSTARKENDYAQIIALYFALIGGEKVFKDVRDHVTKEKGYFSQSEMLEIIGKINAFFPKAGNSATKRSWQTTK